MIKEFFKNLIKYEFLKRFNFQKKQNGDFNLLGEYLVSTDKGIFLIKKNTIEKKLNISTFGIALSKKNFFISTSVNNNTQILKCDLRNFLEDKYKKWTTIFSKNISSDAGRVHQIDYLNENIWIANTAQNTLTKISVNGEWKANIAPFFCEDGHPINIDHNHINAVNAFEDFLIFTAFKGFKKSIVGLVGKGKVYYFYYKNIGIHDCLIEENKFIFSDTFRFWDHKGHGSLIIDGKRFNENFLKKNHAHCIRGYSSSNEEFVCGSSNFGDREKRYNDKASIIVGNKNKFNKSIKINASQIYDIIRKDGFRNDDEKKKKYNFYEAKKIIEKALGKPKRVRKISECFIGKTAKKFDDSDLWQLPEYGC